jgi:uncharacterized membrane protein YhaH (DUF805 family)
MFVALSLLLAAVSLLPGAAKLTGHPKMRESASRFGIRWHRYRLIGVAEVAAAAGVLVGLWWHPLGVAAAAGMALLLTGAVITHRRAKDSGKEMAAALLALAITIAYLAAASIG